MGQILKPILAVLILMIANTSVAYATMASYNITGVFFEPNTSIGHTTFTGTFNWDADTETVSGLHGSQNVTMWDPSDYPDLNLDYQLAQSVNGNIVTASVFLKNTTDVFSGGGYEAGDVLRYGNNPAHGLPADGNTPNDNAYFSFAFDKTSMTGILDEMVYGDCSPGGMMGQVCMTGHSIAKVGYPGTMNAVPMSLEISAVPIPAAVWLFGSGLVGLLGLRRKKAQAS